RRSRAHATSSLMAGRRANDADARKLTALAFCFANEAFDGVAALDAARQVYDYLGKLRQRVAPADRRPGDAKVRASQAAHLSGCTSLGPFRFPQTRRPTAAHLLCDAGYLYQRCLSSFTEFLRGLMRPY